MHIKPGFMLRSMGEDHIVIGEGLAQVNFNSILSLNESAAFLWENLEGKEFTVEDMVRLLMEEYEVDEELATRDALSLAETWKDQGVVE